MPRTTPRLPLILLATMTVLTLGGPLGIGAVLRGGASPAWPPDRAVEWAVLIAVSASVAGLMFACCGLALANRRGTARPNAETEARRGEAAGDRP